MICYPKNVGVSITFSSHTIWKARCEACDRREDFSTDEARQAWATFHAEEHLRWTLNAATIDRAAVGRAMPGETTSATAERVGKEGKTHYMHNDRIFAVGLPDEIICYARDLDD